MDADKARFNDTPTGVKKLVPVDDAVGMVLPHDITEIVPGKKKGPAFKKGHVIQPEDVPRLKDLGKFNIYCLELGPDMVHENEAGVTLGRLACGPGVETDLKVSEGKVTFKASIPGLFKVDEGLLYEINLLGDVMISTRHSNTQVSKGETVAAGRAIPLVIERRTLLEAEAILNRAQGLLKVLPWKIKRSAIVVTGREVFEGRIKDAFGPAMKKKLESHDVEVMSVVKVPDDVSAISRAIKEAMDSGAQLVLCTGGMSVDPDDVTRKGIASAGATSIVYGTPVLPGAMFLVSYIGDVPVLGIPACGMYFKTTVLDIVLPRILAGERLGREDIARLGHGGLCLSCKKCHYPICPFGK
ncbi:MAG: molybdopterin-binding protein [Thermodesulfobacteria bacterium]|nr:molybdopterin-binding protein [Thermodesulfobacteriota bacterium]